MNSLLKDYARRADGVLAEATASLEHENDLSLSNCIRRLACQTRNVLETTAEEESLLKKDAIKFQCSREPKLEELDRLSSLLASRREERLERADEIEREFEEVSKSHAGALANLNLIQQAKSNDAKQALDLSKSAFEQEYAKLCSEKELATSQLAKAKEDNAAAISEKNKSIARLLTDVESLSATQQEETAAIGNARQSTNAEYEVESKLRLELDDHFSLVDMNNAIKREEEAKLETIAAIEREAQGILDHATVGFQRLWRGRVSRTSVAKMKKKKSGKNKKKGGKRKT